MASYSVVTLMPVHLPGWGLHCLGILVMPFAFRRSEAWEVLMENHASFLDGIEEFQQPVYLLFRFGALDYSDVEPMDAKYA